MKTSELDIDIYNNVKPDKVLEYLRLSGWHKHSNFSDRAAIWVYNNANGKQFQALLPLTTDIPDYASRMDDVFRVLALVEQRSQSEIFNDLVDVTAIATDKGREVLNLRFNFDSDVTGVSEIEASAKHLGVILESLQNLFDSIAQVKAGRPSPFGKVAKEITDQARLSILGTFKGSFGVRLAIAPKPEQQQLSLTDTLENQPLGELVIDEFFKVLEQSHDRNFEHLSDRLTNLQRRTTSNYRKFLLSLSDADASLAIDWGSLNTNRGGSARITAEDAIASIETIKKLEVEAPQEYQVMGELLAASKTGKTFELRNMEDDSRLSGKISDEILEDRNIKLTIGTLYNATLREKIAVSSITGEGKVDRVLIKIHPWHLEA
jgi:hypothetical protein